jgi:hypothetical protein
VGQAFADGIGKLQDSTLGKLMAKVPGNPFSMMEYAVRGGVCVCVSIVDIVNRANLVELSEKLARWQASDLCVCVCVCVIDCKIVMSGDGLSKATDVAASGGERFFGVPKEDSLKAVGDLAEVGQAAVNGKLCVCVCFRMLIVCTTVASVVSGGGLVANVAANGLKEGKIHSLLHTHTHTHTTYMILVFI